MSKSLNIAKNFIYFCRGNFHISNGWRVFADMNGKLSFRQQVSNE